MSTTSPTVEPLGDRVLVKVIARERMSTGGVILPDQAREQSDRGLVLAVGPGTPIDAESALSHRPVPVEEHDVVVFSPYAGTKVTLGNDDLLLLREHDLLGILRGVELSEEDGELRVKEREPVSTS